MVKIKVSEASAPVLNWMVATLDGYKNLRKGVFSGVLVMDPPRVAYGAVELSSLDYSTDGNQGMAIIEREGICLKSEARDHSMWAAQFAYTKEVLRLPKAQLVHSYCLQRGPTPLIAAMRCYVTSKLGDEVEVPEELMP